MKHITLWLKSPEGDPDKLEFDCESVGFSNDVVSFYPRGWGDSGNTAPSANYPLHQIVRWDEQHLPSW